MPDTFNLMRNMDLREVRFQQDAANEMKFYRLRKDFSLQGCIKMWTSDMN